MKINVLTNNTSPSSKAFNCPLLVSRPYFEEKGCNLAFHWNITDKVYCCDLLLINSNVFRPFWVKNKDAIFRFLDASVKSRLKIFWFDTTDSTWCTQFEVMPYVDLFLKSHLLKDRRLYLKNFRTGRIFTDFFDELYGSGEKTESYPPVREDQLCKIVLSWAPCFEHYDENRYSWRRRVANKILPLKSRFLGETLDLEFYPPRKTRRLDVSARFGLAHSRPSVVAHRKAVASILKNRACNCDRIPLKEYFAEMRDAKLSISPFGVGEFCYRDYETVVCGATLLKPDMGHMETWPNLYQAGITYIPHRWDISDLNGKIDFFLSNPEKQIEIAENAQKVYKEAVSSGGIAAFAERLMKIIT